MDEKSLDERLQILSDPRRRRVIHRLRAGERDETTIEELTEALQSEGSEQREVTISLRHHHLPKLAACDLVEYDHDTGIISYRADGELEELLDQLPEERPTATL